MCISLRIECDASMVEPEFIGGLSTQSMTTHAMHCAYLDLAQPRWRFAPQYSSQPMRTVGEIAPVRHAVPRIDGCFPADERRHR